MTQDLPQSMNFSIFIGPKQTPTDQPRRRHPLLYATYNQGEMSYGAPQLPNGQPELSACAWKL